MELGSHSVLTSNIGGTAAGNCYGTISSFSTDLPPIRSERRLCHEVHLNLAYRWFCRFSLEGGRCRITRRSQRTSTAASGRALATSQARHTKQVPMSQGMKTSKTV